MPLQALNEFGFREVWVNKNKKEKNKETNKSVNVPLERAAHFLLMLGRHFVEFSAPPLCETSAHKNRNLKVIPVLPLPHLCAYDVCI